MSGSRPMFEDSDWGNSAVFSYYDSPKSHSNNPVPSSLEEGSLQKMGKKRKRDGMKKHPDKRQREGDGEVSGQIKKLKKKAGSKENTSLKKLKKSVICKEKTSMISKKLKKDVKGLAAQVKKDVDMVPGNQKKNKKKKKKFKERESPKMGKTASKIVSEVPVCAVASSEQESYSNLATNLPKKKKKNLEEKESNSSSVKNEGNVAEASSTSVRKPGQKKNNSGKRNKYKKLNIEQKLGKGNFNSLAARGPSTVDAVPQPTGHACNDKSDDTKEKKVMVSRHDFESPSKDLCDVRKKKLKEPFSKKKGRKESTVPKDLKEKKKVKKKKISLEIDNSDNILLHNKEKQIKVKNAKGKKKERAGIDRKSEDCDKEHNQIKKEGKKALKKRKLKSKKSLACGDTLLKGKTKKKKDMMQGNDETISDNDSNDSEEIKMKEEVSTYLESFDFDKIENNNLSSDDNSGSDDEGQLMKNQSLEEDSGDEYIADEDSDVDKGKEILVSDHRTSSDKLMKTTFENGCLTNVEKSNLRKEIDSLNVHKDEKYNKEILAKMLLEAAKQSNPIQSAPSAAETLRKKMMSQLNAARFRLVNEQMYTATSSEAAKMFSSDKNSFHMYHSGFQKQVSSWPMNPLDLIIKWLKNKPKYWVVADMGCGEAKLAESVPQNTVHSFDLVATNSRITACDMSHTPLKSNTVDAVVFCLSLMGTNIKDFIMEANRILKEGGIMKIAEVESRFKDTKYFTNLIRKYGFNCVYADTSTKYFYMFEFKKHRNLTKKVTVPDIILKPCKYKKR